ncbi:MAG: GGDEF domain-containing protein [Lachnoclostridium sp.]|nr:GGDEF domain-containing protein [Lachnoclostridium sp.]
MYNNGKETIGVFICEAVNSFQRYLCEGITKRATELGYNVAFFTGFFVGESKWGEKAIFNLPDYSKLAGIIIAIQTFQDRTIVNELINQIEENFDGPVISELVKTDHFYNILINEETSIEPLCEHFINHHGYRDIGFMSGPSTSRDAIKRLECYKRVMKKYGLPVTDDLIFEGDFWKKKGKDACDYWVKYHGKIPEAIICANDYMAISVCNELISRGVRIPDETAICGYDGIANGLAIVPTLTTIQVPVLEMGEKSVQIIHDANKGIPCEQDFYFDNSLILRESCGCNKPERILTLKRQKDYYVAAEEAKQIDIDNTFLSISMENITDTAGLYEVVFNHIFQLKDYKSLMICFNESLEQTHTGRMIDDPFDENMKLIVSIRKYVLCEHTDTLFPRNYLLPENVISSEPQIYYFFPIHFKVHCFGYIALSTWEGGGYSNTLSTYMTNIGGGLENMFIRKRMERLIADLEDMYIRDMLTGLYNRRGFEQLSKEYFEKASKERKYLFVASLDLDYLKVINDKLGHMIGDEAIMHVGEALHLSAEKNEICARVGGDEFMVIGMYCNQNGEEKFLGRFEKYIDEKRKLAANYHLDVSYGSIILVPKADTKLSDLIIESDQNMYEMKRKKKGDKNGIETVVTGSR